MKKSRRIKEIPAENISAGPNQMGNKEEERDQDSSNNSFWDLYYGGQREEKIDKEKSKLKKRVEKSRRDKREAKEQLGKLTTEIWIATGTRDQRRRARKESKKKRGEGVRVRVHPAQAISSTQGRANGHPHRPTHVDDMQGATGTARGRGLCISLWWACVMLNWFFSLMYLL